MEWLLEFRVFVVVVLVMITVVAMALDLITGLIKARVKHEVVSGKMRDGFWKKVAFFSIIVIAGIYEAATLLIRINVPESGMVIALPALPTIEFACAWILLTEIVSIMENLIEINPKIKKSPFAVLLKLKHDDDADMQSIETVAQEVRDGYDRQ